MRSEVLYIDYYNNSNSNSNSNRGIIDDEEDDQVVGIFNITQKKQTPLFT